MVHGESRGRHQEEHLGLELTNQLEEREVIGRLKRQMFVVND